MEKGKSEAQADRAYIEREKFFETNLQQAKANFETKWIVAVQKQSNSPFQLSDLKPLKELGEGAFGKVLLVQYDNSDVYYAMKMYIKKMVVKTKQTKGVVNEKRILQSIDCSFAVRVVGAFQDNANLYLVMNLINGGELFHHLVKAGKFSEIQARFYCAQVLIVLEYLHNLKIIYRDLKPENMLLDCEGYLKIGDFGFAKIITSGRRTYTFCGTPEYIAPEIIKNKGYGFPADWWAFGILIYELNSGRTPFRNKDHMKMYESIVDGQFSRLLW